jgi:geranylgeranyl pyrophosphate synthase
MTAAGTYADCLGLAFQIRDDILDVVGDAALLGKATGTDAHKNTFVRLYGIERCKEMVAEQTRSAIEALAPYGASADFLISLAQSLVDREM